LAIGGLAARGTTQIEDAGCVDISYPGFFDDLARLAGPDRVEVVAD
jgi:3-phosphoshikimate 1-carboxyvinyltransferase